MKMTTLFENLFSFIEELQKQTTVSQNIETQIIKWVKLICNKIKIPVLTKYEDVPYNEDDFPQFSTAATDGLDSLHKLLEEAIALNNRSDVKLSTSTATDVCLNCVVVAAQYYNSDTCWGGKQSSQAAQKMLLLLLSPDHQNSTGIEKLNKTETNQISSSDKSGTASDSLEDLIKNNCKIDSDTEHSKNPPNVKVDSLSSVNQYRMKSVLIRFGSLLQPLLQYLSNNFIKETWKNNPGVREFYLWFFYNLTANDVSEQLAYLLPGALCLLDDWEPRHKLAGLALLAALLHAVPGPSLRLHGRAAVVFEVAQRHLYSRDAEQLAAAYPVATAAAAALAADPSVAHDLTMTPPEQVLSLLLRDMRYEQRLDLRSVYARALTPAIIATGARTARWSGDVVAVVGGYVEYVDGGRADDAILALQAARVWLQCCWASLSPQSAEVLLTALLCLICDVTDPPEAAYTDTADVAQTRAQLLSLSSDVVQLLFAAAPATCRHLCNGINDLPLPPRALQAVRHACAIPTAAGNGSANLSR